MNLHVIQLELSEAASGSTRTVDARRRETCPTCKHEGIVSRLYFGPCRSCNDSKTIERVEQLVVDVPAGCMPGTTLAPRSGDTTGAGITIAIEVHERLTLNGRDLVVDRPVTVPAAMAESGGALTVEGLDRLVRVEVPAGTTDGATLRVPGMGYPARDGGPGDLVVTVGVIDSSREAAEARLTELESEVRRLEARSRELLSERRLQEADVEASEAALREELVALAGEIAVTAGACDLMDYAAPLLSKVVPMFGVLGAEREEFVELVEQLVERGLPEVTAESATQLWADARVERAKILHGLGLPDAALATLEAGRSGSPPWNVDQTLSRAMRSMEFGTLQVHAATTPWVAAPFILLLAGLKLPIAWYLLPVCVPVCLAGLVYTQSLSWIRISRTGLVRHTPFAHQEARWSDIAGFAYFIQDRLVNGRFADTAVTIHLSLASGETVKLGGTDRSETDGAFRKLVVALTATLGPRLLQQSVARLEERGEVRFGPITVGHKGLSWTSTWRSGETFLAWEDVERVQVWDGRVTIRKRGAWFAAYSASTLDIPNVSAFLALVKIERPDMLDRSVLKAA
jgi:hypothetical protein